MFNKWTRSCAERYRHRIESVRPEPGGEWKEADKLMDRQAVARHAPFCERLVLNVLRSQFQNATIEGTKQGLIDCQPSGCVACNTWAVKDWHWAEN